MSEIGEVFRDCLKDMRKELVLSVMMQEVDNLCGGFYHPDQRSEFKRAGCAIGEIILNGVRIKIKRPRVRRYLGDKSGEEKLVSYVAAKDCANITSMVLYALSAGLSSRNIGHLNPGGLFRSKSSVSRLLDFRRTEKD